jgi:uncharacterized protein (TIGR02118 family)
MSREFPDFPNCLHRVIVRACSTLASNRPRRCAKREEPRSSGCKIREPDRPRLRPPQEGEGAYYAHTEASPRRRINYEAGIKPRRLIQECPMIKVFGYLKRKPGLSPQEFADYYEHNHVPLVLSKAFMPMVYKRNYIQRGDAFNIEGNEISFDCMTELVFAGRDDLSVWMASLGVDEIARDEENFIDRAATRAYVVDERSSAG